MTGFEEIEYAWDLYALFFMEDMEIARELLQSYGIDPFTLDEQEFMKTLMDDLLGGLK